MKVRKLHFQAAVFIAVYLFALYLWTLPFQDNKAPYGEFDAISHWELGDFIAQRDSTFVYLPAFLDFSYATDNKYKPHTLWYHPPFHTDLAAISAFSNDRMVPIFLTNAVFASAILISVFFVISRLFGFLPGILSMFLLTFSMRDIMPYLWGQWPERLGYAFIPLILYCFYMYHTTYSKQESRPVYLYVMSLLLAVNVFMHPLSFFHSLAGLLVLGIALSIKERKLPFNAKHLGISLLIFLVMFSIFPYQSGNVIVSFFGSGESKGEAASLSRLLHWGPNPADFEGSVPPSYFSFKDMHRLWTLPFLLLGLVVLIIRRENRDIFLLAWLFSLYLVLHRDLIGNFAFLHRSLSATAHIFIPITVIGALSVASFVKLPKYNQFLKYGMASLVVALGFAYNFPAAYSTLDNAYDSPLIRINQEQIDVSEWLQENTNENDNVSVIGPPAEIMQKVWWMASYSHRTSHFFEGFLLWKTYEENREQTITNHVLNDYIVFDYSDISLLSDRSYVERWLEFERNNFGNHTLVYNKGNIRVYKYAAS